MNLEKSSFSEYQGSTFDSFELQLNSDAKDFLRGAASWGMGFAILGFIGSGLILLMALVMIATGGMQSGMPTASMGILYLIIGIMYFLPMLFLLKFSNNAKRALDESNNQQLTDSFKNLKNHFLSAVISVIVIFVTTIIFVVVMAATVASQF